VLYDHSANPLLIVRKAESIRPQVLFSLNGKTYAQLHFDARTYFPNCAKIFVPFLFISFMVVIHKIKPEGLHLRIDVELIDAQDTALPTQVIHVILLLFSDRIKRAFVNDLIRQNFPDLRNGRMEIVIRLEDSSK
jgi:hypothetical protein